ncbi:HAD family hydrolase [Aeromicrobium sp.]|uniref:HAD family hydrolase n=1 Tax=Aeromicrobium sp. TaxID=1871063 RepID=UPI004034E53E
MSPRLLATDLDGTLLRSDGTVSDRTREAVAAAERRGVTVLFVTARPPRWVDHLADVVGPHGIALCGNGAFVHDVAARRVVRTRAFSPSALREVVRDLRAALPGVTFAVEPADGFVRDDAFLDPYAHEYEVGIVEDVLEVGKILARRPGTSSQQFLAQVREVVGERAELGFSGSDGLAELTVAGVTKATALADWCAEHGFDSSQVWACGDMPNDLPMLAWAGRGIAVANAHPEVLAAADEVVGHHDDDAVASVLDRLA